MHRWSDSPIVTLARGGEEISLGRSGRDAVLHMQGSTGLGVAPVETAMSDRLGSDGSIARGVRYGSREVFIPLFVEQGSTGELHEWRRALTRLVAPVPGDPIGSLVDITLDDPTTGSVRTVRGLYKGGLDGDFGSDYRGTWQTLGLTFECPDPWWLGPEQIHTLQVAPGTKPFLSESVPFFPVTLAASSVLGEWDVEIQGDGEVWPSWEVVGPGRDLVIESGSRRLAISGDFPATPTLIQTRPRRITPRARFKDLAKGSTLFPLAPGRHKFHVSMVGADTSTVVRLVYRERYREGI